MKIDDGSISRRDLLTTLARTGMAAPLALGSLAYASQNPTPPANVRILGGTVVEGNKAILTASDLQFKGFVRLSKDGGDLWFADGGLALRKVNGQPRLFVFGNRTESNPVLEYVLPDTPNTTLGSAPIAPLAKNWGTIMEGRTITGGSGAYYPGGLHWDAERNAIWWSYGDSYVPVQNHPTHGCTILNDGPGTSRSFGPWRTQWTSQRTRGAFCTIPSEFASKYTSGKNVGVMATQTSGNGASPFGAVLSAMKLPDPTNTPADVATNKNWTIENQGIILHDLDHRQARDTRYKFCGWNVKYDCKQGAPLDAGVPLFGGPFPASNSDDTMLCSTWIDLPDKHGLLYFGQLVTTPEGYKAPGDPDGYVHQWYGSAYHHSSPSGLGQVCCHDQDDPWWGSTGPGAHRRVPMGWIYNPNDLVASALGKADLWSRTPSSTFQWKTYWPFLHDRYGAGMIGGSVFDAATRRLYVLLTRHDDITHPPHPRPVVLVFDIK